MMNWIKKVIVLFLAGTMVLGLAACGDGVKQGGNKANNEEAKKNVYKYEDIDLGLPTDNDNNEKGNKGINTMHLLGDRLYVVMNDYNYMDNINETKISLVSVNIDGSDKQETLLLESKVDYSMEITQETYLGRMSISDTGVYAIEEGYDYQNVDEYGNASRTMNLIFWNLNGEEQWRVSLLPEEVQQDQYYYVNDLFPLQDGEILVYSSMSMDVYTNTGEKKSSIALQDEMSYGYDSMFMGKDGNIYVTSYNDEYTKQYLSVLDIHSGKTGEPMELPANFSRYNLMGAGVQYDLLLNNGTGLYGFNIGDEMPSIIMNYVNSDLVSTNLYNVVQVSDTQMIATYNDEEYYNAHVAMFTYVDPKDIPDKETLILGSLYMGYNVRGRVVEFNKTNEKYRIVVREYSQYSTTDDYMAGYTQLNNDIVAGKVPDILVLDDGMPIDSYIAKGLFADINEFIDQDEELNREDYFENVLDAYSIEGKMYRIVPSFYVQTFMGKASDVGTEPGWTMQELKDVMATKPEGTNIFSLDYLRDSVMDIAMNLSGYQFIDQATGKCSFNSPAFIEMLEFIKQFPTVDPSYDDGTDWWTEYQSQYHTGKTLLASVYLYSPADLVYTLKSSFGEEPTTFIGFPTEQGNGSVIGANEQYAISAKSSSQAGAWEFLRYYYTDEYQRNSYAMPVSKEIWKELSKKSMEKPYWENENGVKEYYEYTTWIGDTEVSMEPLTQEEVDSVYNFISSLNQVYSYDENLMSIINEEAAAFFEGQKTAAEVADIIQSRVQIYVNENR